MKAFARHMVEDQFRGKLLSAETDRDHMHLLVSLPPTPTFPCLYGASRHRSPGRCARNSQIRSISTSMVKKFLSGATVILLPLPGVFPWRSSGSILKTRQRRSIREKEAVRNGRPDSIVLNIFLVIAFIPRAFLTKRPGFSAKSL